MEANKDRKTTKKGKGKGKGEKKCKLYETVLTEGKWINKPI